MAVNIPFLEKAFFYFDKPVPYILDDKTNDENKTIEIRPVNLVDSEIFLASVGLLMIDKNSAPNVEIIQMSYLDFIVKILLQGEEGELNRQRFVNILKLCLNMDDPRIAYDNDGKPHLLEMVNENIEMNISAKQFDDIKRIILYQNISGYDDSYINPEVKASMAEVDEYKNRDIEIPNLERKMAIITSHTGIPKNKQLEMTLRSHTMLFEEVCGEVDFNTTRAIALYTGQADKIDHWIFKKKKGKFDDYFMSTKQFNKTMGGDGNIAVTSLAN